MKGRKANLLMMTMLCAWQMAGRKSSKMNNSSATESELWRNAGPSAFQLLKSDKNMTYISCD